ncbi:uncharacterized protein EAF02_003182 [Botrytis sinoallii]|uniref:uncharacterized protein n=1 Tax=Botrytis sinoallii TaxID=1463999 RepID=UPI001901C405|nr:uncharacterized protein EAF02_003182 [Botrytis sinoallii]KAF7888641.1 hypothetical protein EAF02_003182 [Botrytis sinoallii]
MADGNKSTMREDEGVLPKEQVPSSYIPNNFTLPGQELQRLPVISCEISVQGARAIIPELQVIASELRVLEGRIHFSHKSSKRIYNDIISDQQHPKRMKEIDDNRERQNARFKEPALDLLTIEQDLIKDLEPIPQDLTLVRRFKPIFDQQREILKRKKTIPQQKPQNGMRILYVHAEDKLYPRSVKGTAGRIKLIPVFQFSERVTNLEEIEYSKKDQKLVLSKELSKDMLEHCVLRIDHNDYLLNDWRNFVALPTEDQSVGETSMEVVKNHLLHGRWVWITKETEICRRSIVIERTSQLYDARLMYILGNDIQLPNRLESLKNFTQSRRRKWDTWEKSQEQQEFYLASTEAKLWRWVHGKAYVEGEGGPLAWINHENNNDLARFSRLENQGHRDWRTRTAIFGKRIDRSLSIIPPMVKIDSGLGGMEEINNSGEPSSSPTEFVSTLKHLPGCDKTNTPGFGCDCPGPARKEGNQLNDDCSEKYQKRMKSLIAKGYSLELRISKLEAIVEITLSGRSIRKRDKIIPRSKSKRSSTGPIPAAVTTL